MVPSKKKGLIPDESKWKTITLKHPLQSRKRSTRDILGMHTKREYCNSADTKKGQGLGLGKGDETTSRSLYS